MSSPSEIPEGGAKETDRAPQEGLESPSPSSAQESEDNEDGEGPI